MNLFEYKFIAGYGLMDLSKFVCVIKNEFG